MKYNRLSSFSLLIIILLFINVLPADGQTQELEIYNEWYCSDSNLFPERPFFVIKDVLEFQSFWEKTNFGGYPPHLDFEKYMVFVWAPKPTRKDCNKVEFERLLYKNGALLVLMNLEGHDKYMTGSLKKPVKAVVFPKIKSGDIFIYRKVKTGWEQFKWTPVYAIWDMSVERKRPFEYVYVDKDNKPLYETATTTANPSVTIATTPLRESESTTSVTNAIVATEQESNVYTPKQSAVSMPRELPEAKTLSTSTTKNNAPIQPITTVANPPANQTPTKPEPVSTSTNAKTTSDPINIGNTPAPKIDKDAKPEVAPGMGEDPLFGSEFDITF